MKVFVFRSFLTLQDIKDIHGVQDTPFQRKPSSAWKLRLAINKTETKDKYKTKIDTEGELPCEQPRIDMKDKLERTQRRIDEAQNKYEATKNKQRKVKDSEEVMDSLSPIEL